MIWVFVLRHRTYLINATSKQDRDEWIEAIRDATPSLGGQGASKRSMEEPVLSRSSAAQPPPYSAGPGRQPYSDPPVPPSFEKKQDLGPEFTPASYNRPGPPSWQQQHPNEITPRRVPEEPKRPAYPPRPPARQASPTAAGLERREQPKSLESPPIAAVRKTPAASWQQPVPVNVGPPKVPEDVTRKQQQPLKPKPPVRGYPGATTPAAGAASSGGRGDTRSKSAVPESGDQWIKAIRKSTNTKPTTWGTNATSPIKEDKVDSGQMEFKRARERLINAMGTSTSSSSPQKQRSTASPVQIRQEPKKPAPPPPPEEHEPTLYVNIDDIENEDDSSSDDDNPAQQPPPYRGPTAGAPRTMTPVSMESLGRHMGGMAHNIAS